MGFEGRNQFSMLPGSRGEGFSNGEQFTGYIKHTPSANMGIHMEDMRIGAEITEAQTIPQ